MTGTNERELLLNKHFTFNLYKVTKVSTQVPYVLHLC